MVKKKDTLGFEVRNIIGIVGMPAAEKTIVAEFLSEISGIISLRMSEIVEEEIVGKNKEPEAIKYRETVEHLREKFGKDIIARRTLERARNKRLSSVIVDGIRNLEEVNFLRSKSKKIILICVHSSPAIRYERLMSEEIGPRSLSKDECRDLDNHNLSLGIADAIALADYIIINDKLKSENLKTKVRTLYAEIKECLIEELKIKEEEE